MTSYIMNSPLVWSFWAMAALLRSSWHYHVAWCSSNTVHIEWVLLRWIFLDSLRLSFRTSSVLMAHPSATIVYTLQACVVELVDSMLLPCRASSLSTTNASGKTVTVGKLVGSIRAAMSVSYFLFHLSAMYVMSILSLVFLCYFLCVMATLRNQSSLLSLISSLSDEGLAFSGWFAFKSLTLLLISCLDFACSVEGWYSLAEMLSASIHTAADHCRHDVSIPEGLVSWQRHNQHSVTSLLIQIWSVFSGTGSVCPGGIAFSRFWGPWRFFDGEKTHFEAFPCPWCTTRIRSRCCGLENMLSHLRLPATSCSRRQ